MKFPGGEPQMTQNTNEDAGQAILRIFGAVTVEQDSLFDSPVVLAAFLLARDQVGQRLVRDLDAGNINEQEYEDQANARKAELLEAHRIYKERPV